jgi:hypothetical protein
MFSNSSHRAEIEIAGDHKLSHKCAKLFLNACEIAAIASGGLTLVPSVRRIMTDIAILDDEAGRLQIIQRGGRDRTAELPV